MKAIYSTVVCCHVSPEIAFTEAKRLNVCLEKKLLGHKEVELRVDLEAPVQPASTAFLFWVNKLPSFVTHFCGCVRLWFYQLHGCYILMSDGN